MEGKDFCIFWKSEPNVPIYWLHVMKVSFCEFFDLGGNVIVIVRCRGQNK